MKKKKYVLVTKPLLRGKSWSLTWNRRWRFGIWFPKETDWDKDFYKWIILLGPFYLAKWKPKKHVDNYPWL